MKVSNITAGQAFAAAAIISLAATVLLVLNYDGTWLHPDTAQALSVARNVRDGNGFSTGLIYYEEHYQLNTWPAPQTVFPIGFPAMIAVFGATGLSLRLASLWIGITGFLFVPLLICVAAQRMGRRPATGLLLAVVWLCFPMLWHNVWERQTEMMFITLTLGSLILLQSPWLGTRRLLLAGIFAAIAFSLRYAGIFWLMAVGGVFLIQFVRQRWSSVQQAATFFAIPCMLAITLFARNAVLVGDIKGGNNKAVHRTLTEAGESAYYAVSRLTGLDKTNLFAGEIAEAAVVVGLGLLLAAAIICGVKMHRPESRRHLAFGTVGDSAVFLYLGVSLTALIGLEKTTSINLSPRMFFPLIPFTLLALADLVSRMLVTLPERSGRATWQRRQIVAASGLLIAGVLSGQFRAAAEVRGHVHRFGMVDVAVNQIVDHHSGPVALSQLLVGKRILSDESHMLAEVLQQGTVGLTSTTYTARIWTDEEVIALIRRYQINRIVVFPDVRPKDSNPFFESLMDEGKRHESSRHWLEPVLVSPRIQIYAVRDSLLLTQQF
ncbi:MAG: hypothetical protein WKF77_05080 [Planctomycetaceae bacterium]